MKTFDIFADKTNIPTTAAWNLSDLTEAQDKQQRFTKKLPQLNGLQKLALIESAISSNRIEGVTIDHSRIDIVLFGNAPLQVSDEREVRGYADALTVIHQQAEKLPVSEQTVLRLHRLSRANVGDAGQYKRKDSEIIEKYPDGRERVRFKTVSAQETPAFMGQLIEAWQQCQERDRIHPLIAMAAMNLDFLCIHPFRDGNGRVSRLLLLMMCYQLGFEVGRYISLERLIEENKDRYYETLEQSSQGWHQGKHDPWPFVNYLLFILKHAYREFEERVGQLSSPRGSKTEMIISAIDRSIGSFQVADIQRQCPGVSMDMIRKVLKDRRAQVRCLGRGKDAKWEKTAKWQIR